MGRGQSALVKRECIKGFSDLHIACFTIMFLPIDPNSTGPLYSGQTMNQDEANNVLRLRVKHNDKYPHPLIIQLHPLIFFVLCM